MEGSEKEVGEERTKHYISKILEEPQQGPQTSFSPSG